MIESIRKVLLEHSKDEDGIMAADVERITLLDNEEATRALEKMWKDGYLTRFHGGLGWSYHYKTDNPKVSPPKKKAKKKAKKRAKKKGTKKATKKGTKKGTKKKTKGPGKGYKKGYVEINSVSITLSIPERISKKIDEVAELEMYQSRGEFLRHILRKWYKRVTSTE